MDRFRRILNVLAGIGMILTAALILAMDSEHGLKLALIIIQTGMTVRGLNSLLYYLKLARFMVGGKNVLYRGMIYLDLGVVAGSIFDNAIVYTVVYIALLHVFSGAVSVLRARESKKIGGHWRLKMVYGVTGILLAAAVVISGVIYKSPDITTYIYSGGLIYQAALRIAGAFRRTEIVYIQ